MKIEDECWLVTASAVFYGAWKRINFMYHINSLKLDTTYSIGKKKQTLTPYLNFIIWLIFFN